MSLSLYVGPDSQPDKYRLVRSLGRGGGATLHLAEATLPGRTEPVVVKALDVGSRWAEQAELLRSVDRPGVVGVREHFEGAAEHPQGGARERTGRRLYLVADHVDGLDLRAWRAGRGAPGPGEALRYLEQAARELDVLHTGQATPSGRSVVHGDLSPGAVMVGADGRVTLVGFGPAGPAPGYAAPETSGGGYGPAADRYAFGAVAFHALTGEDPPASPERLRERFAALPLLADAEERTRALVASMFSDDPAERPEASEWVRALRTQAASAPGPDGEPEVAPGDPGTSAVFAASLFDGAARAADPAPAQDPEATAAFDSSVLPQGPAVAGPPPADTSTPGVPGDTDTTVVLSPSSGAGTPAAGVPGSSSGSQDASAPGAPQVPSAPAVTGGAQVPAAPQRTSAPGGAPAPDSAQAPSAPADPQGTDATVVLSPTPAFGTAAAGGDTPASGSEVTAVLPPTSADGQGNPGAPSDGPGVEDMPHRPVGGLRGRPVQQRPAPAAQPSAPPAPTGPPPRRPGGPTPPRGTARPPMPAPSGPAWGPPTPRSQPAWGPPPPSGTTGAFPAYGHPPAPEPPARKRSRKPLVFGLAAFAALCMIGGSALTYVVMDRGLPFAGGDSQQVSAGASAEPSDSAEEEAPPMAAGPGETSRGETTLLTQMEIVDSSQGRWLPGTGRAELNGEAYTRALVSTGCGDLYLPCTGWADYNLGRRWSTLTATIGVDDTSSASATTTFTVHLDGEPAVTETLALGETRDIEVDVRDVLRLRIEVESDANGIYPVWADPALTS